jgi:hypothetical protein
MIRTSLCHIDSNGDHDTTRPKDESANDFREVFLGWLVRRGWTELPFFCRVNGQPVPVRARQRASSTTNQIVRRQKRDNTLATQAWKPKYLFSSHRCHRRSATSLMMPELRAYKDFAKKINL